MVTTIDMQPIHVRDLGAVRPAKVRAIIAQLHSHDSDWQAYNCLISLKDPTHFDTAILEVIAGARRHTADLIQFPELSVPFASVETLREWSAETGGVVIAGSHYHSAKHGVISRSPIIIAGEVHFTEKRLPSPLEVSAIGGQGLVPGFALNVFRNSPVGNFGVLICSDYLDKDIRAEMLQHDLDILCVSAFQRHSQVYHDRMQLDVAEASRGIFVLYSNMRSSPGSDGKSAVFGQMDDLYSRQFKDAGLTDLTPSNKVLELADSVRWLATELDISNKRPSLPRNVHSRPNVLLLEKPTTVAATTSRFLTAIAHDDERYRRILDLFVAPREYESIAAKLEESKLVFITGDPGIGKTYTAARLLRHYFDRGYSPSWYTGLEKAERQVQRQVLEGFEPAERQVIYFEDPFGRSSFEHRDAIYTVFGPLVDRLRKVDARVIVTSRRDVFEIFLQESLSGKELDSFREEMSIYKPSYSENALWQITKQLAADRCKWWNCDACRELVKNSIMTSQLSTPLAIRDFVLTSVNAEDPGELENQLLRRHKEAARAFAMEIRQCSLASRLSLLMVYLFGTRHQLSINRSYGHFSRSSGDEELVKATLIEQLRPHLGYRIEQFGSHVRGFRFAHPLYEEAFVEATQLDIDLLTVARSAAEKGTSDDNAEYARGILRNVKKHPRLTIGLLATLVAVCARGNDIDARLNLAQRLVGAFDATGDTGILSLLSSLISLKELLQYINTTRTCSGVGRILQVAINLTRLAGREEASLDSQIDWNHLARLLGAAHIHPMLEVFQRTREIRPKFFDEFVDQRSDLFFMRRIFASPEEVHRRFVALSKNPRLPRIAESAAALRNEKISMRQWLASSADHVNASVGVIVDKGAIRFLRRGYGLLPAGICGVRGQFDAGEPIAILDTNSNQIGFGIPEYNSNEVEVIRGRHSSQIFELCGVFRGPCVFRKWACMLTS